MLYKWCFLFQLDDKLILWSGIKLGFQFSILTVKVTVICHGAFCELYILINNYDTQCLHKLHLAPVQPIKIKDTPQKLRAFLEPRMHISNRARIAIVTDALHRPWFTCCLRVVDGSRRTWCDQERYSSVQLLRAAHSSITRCWSLKDGRLTGVNLQ